jgi:hypothetical protein
MGKLNSRLTGSLVCGVLLLLASLPAFTSAHTVVELVRTPTTFAQQPVSVVGEVVNVVTRYGDAPYTTFDLLGADDTALPVFVWGEPTFKQGDLCHVTGTFVLEKTVGTHELARGVEAEKVEKVSEAESAAAGRLFRKKRGTGVGPGGKYPRGFFFPQ